MPITSTPLGTMSALKCIALLKQFAAFHQPLLEAFEAPDFPDVGAVGDELDRAAAIDQDALFLEQGRQRLRTESRADGERAAHGVPGLIEAESLQSARELVQSFIAGIGVPLARRDLVRLRSQEFHQFRADPAVEDR